MADLASQPASAIAMLTAIAAASLRSMFGPNFIPTWSEPRDFAVWPAKVWDQVTLHAADHLQQFATIFI